MKQDMQWQIGPPTLTKLEYFAGLIMAEISTMAISTKDKAEWAVLQAQELIAELEKGQGEVMP